MNFRNFLFKIICLGFHMQKFICYPYLNLSTFMYVRIKQNVSNLKNKISNLLNKKVVIRKVNIIFFKYVCIPPK